MSKTLFFPLFSSKFKEEKDASEIFIELAKTATKYLKDNKGNILKSVTLKGENQGYYWSPIDKKMVLVPRKAEFYILPYKKDENGRFMLFLPCFLTNGVIISVEEEDIELLGYN